MFRQKPSLSGNLKIKWGSPFSGIFYAIYKEIWSLALRLKIQTKPCFIAYSPMHYACFENIHKFLPQVRIVAGNRETATFLKAHGVNHSRVPVFPYFVIVANYDHIKKGHTIYPTRVKLIQINHGLGLAKAFYYTASLLRRPMAMYLVSGKLAKQKLIEAGVSGIIEDVGFAKLDKLFDGSIEQATIFNRLNFEPGKPVILYAPTFGELSTMDEVLPYLPAVAANYNLLIKLHQLTYREASIIKSFRSLPNVFFIEDPDCTPYLFVSDLLISDISSIVFEYALLDRPIILILPPEEIWRPAVTDPYWWQVGYHLDNPKQLIPTIKQLLTNGDPEQTAFRRQLFEKTGIPRDGKSAERSASAILSFLGEI